MAGGNVTSYDLGKLIASLGVDSTQFQQGMIAAQASMQSMDKMAKKTQASVQARMLSMGATAQKVGKQMTMYLSLPIAGIAVAAFKAQKDFEASMSKIEGLVGIAREQVQAWEQDILRLGPSVAKGPKELADALFFITSAGIKGAEAMDVLEMSAKASTAGLGETKVIADLVTSAMNAYGKENLSAAQATDILVAAVREGKAEADALAGSMGKVLPITAEMGVSFDQVGAAIAAMTRTGTSADIAATQLKAIMSSLLKPTDRAAESLKRMGTSAGELRKMIREDGLIKTLDHLRRLTNQYGEEAMSNVFPNIRALMGVLDLMGKNAADNITIFNNLTNATGSLDAATAAVAETTKFKWGQAIATLQTSLTEIGMSMKGSIIPIIENITEKIQDATEWWSSLSESQQQVILKMVGLTAAAGPLLTVFGRLSKFIAKNPYLALAAGLALLVTRTIAAVHRTKEMRSIYDGVAIASAKIQDEYTTQALKVKILTERIEDENSANSTRKRAIEDLKKIMPAYNATLTEEGELIGHNTTLIEQQLRAIKEKIALKIFEEEYAEALQKQVDARRSLEEATTKADDTRRAWIEGGKKEYQMYAATNGTIQKRISWEKAAYSAASAEQTKAQKVYEATTTSVEELNTELETLVKTMGGETATIGIKPEGTEGTLKVVGALSKELEAIAKRIQYLYDKKYAKQSNIVDVSIKNYEREVVALFAVEEKLGKVATVVDKTAQKYAQLTAASETLRQSAGYTVSIFNRIADAISLSNEKLADWIAYVGNAVGAVGELISVIKAVVAAKQAEAMGNAIAAGSAYPFPANLLAIGAGVAEVIAAFAMIPQFAEGGIVSGPTMGMIGEYPGARSNPEVIAPLDKLKSLMVGNTTGMPKTIKLVADGRELKAVIDMEMLYQNTY